MAALRSLGATIGGFCVFVASIVACAGCGEARASTASRACGDRVELAGACLDAEEATIVCGAGAVARSGDAARAGGCVSLACRPEDTLDLDRSRCVAPREARAFAERSGVELADDEEPTCGQASDRLVVASQTLTCLPLSALCPRGTRWQSERCAVDPPCAPGSLHDRAARRRGNTCTPVVDRDGVVDVGTWSRIVLGEDGGGGSADLCGAIARSALGFGSPAPQASVRLAIDVAFPDNEVRGATARVRPRIDGAEAPLSTLETTIASDAVASLLVPLRRLGGQANAALVTLSVRCVLPAATKPVTTPRAAPSSSE